jgi:hypothetical protein
MEFFTVFYIEYAIMGREIKTYITLPSSEACQIFIRDNEDMDQYMFADGISTCLQMVMLICGA